MNRPRTGFTLVELIAVMTIIAVALVAIIPALDNMLPSYRLNSAGRTIASNIELAQSEAIARRKEFVMAYNLDDNTYWIVMPPEEEPEPETPEEAEPPLEGLPKAAGTRPQNDLEHGPPPPDPNDPEQNQEAAPDDFEARDKLLPQKLGLDVQYSVIVVGDEEKRSGTVFVPFSHLANTGAHVVGLKLESDEQAQAWVKFNPMTRTIEYAEERPQVRTLAPDGEE